MQLNIINIPITLSITIQSPMDIMWVITSEQEFRADKHTKIRIQNELHR